MFLEVAGEQEVKSQMAGHANDRIWQQILHKLYF